MLRSLVNKLFLPSSDKQKPASSQQDENLISGFQMIRVVGVGSFAKVILVRKKDNQKLYAMKVLNKPDVIKKKQVAHAKAERRILETVGKKHPHPYIVRMHYAFQTSSKLYICLEWCSGGEMFSHLQKARKFSERVTQIYAGELVLALRHLHKNGLVYRDLKPENVLLDADGHIKLCDFGLSKENIFHPSRGARSLCGTPEYIAPEILDRKGHGTSVDYWSLGVCIYEMLTGLPPWFTTNRKKLFVRIRTAELKFPHYLSLPAKQLIEGFLDRDPIARLGSGGIESIKRHPFFDGMDWQKLAAKKIKAPFKPKIKGNSASEDPSDLALNFNPDFLRLPFGSEDQSYSKVDDPVDGDLFGRFTFDEASVPTSAESNCP